VLIVKKLTCSVALPHWLTDCKNASDGAAVPVLVIDHHVDRFKAYSGCCWFQKRL